MTKKQIFALSLIILLFLMSCDLSSLAPAAAPTADIAQAIAQTHQVDTQVAMAVQLTQLASGGGGGAPPASQPTNTPGYTPTSSAVMVTVSIATNCRTGPGSAYPIIGALAVGQTAEVVGRSAASDNWIIKLPSNPAVTCWLWGQYAAVTGNTASLPVIETPPTPTPVAPATISITIYNNCAVTIFYAYISGSDDSNWGSDELGPPNTIPHGASFTWTNYAPYTYDVKVEDNMHNMLWTVFSVSMTTDTYLTACP